MALSGAERDSQGALDTWLVRCVESEVAVRSLRVSWRRWGLSLDSKSYSTVELGVKGAETGRRLTTVTGCGYPCPAAQRTAKPYFGFTTVRSLPASAQHPPSAPASVGWFDNSTPASSDEGDKAVPCAASPPSRPSACCAPRHSIELVIASDLRTQRFGTHVLFFSLPFI